MLPHALLEELHTLDRDNKLKIIQFLVDDLAAEDAASLSPGAIYEIATPYGNEASAQQLFNHLQAHKTENRTETA